MRKNASLTFAQFCIVPTCRPTFSASDRNYNALRQLWRVSTAVKMSAGTIFKHHRGQKIFLPISKTFRSELTTLRTLSPPGGEDRMFLFSQQEAQTYRTHTRLSTHGWMLGLRKTGQPGRGARSGQRYDEQP